MTMLGMLGSTKGKPAKGAGLSLDLFQESFRANGKTPTFSEVVTHSRSGNATMVDSDGLLKWAPHNLVTYSEAFDNNTNIITQNVTVTGNVGVAPDGTSTADRIVGTGAWFRQRNFTHTVGVTLTTNMWVKSNTGSNQTFRIYGDNTQVSENLTATNEWQLFSYEFTVAIGGSSGDGITRDTSNSSADLLVWGHHTYRSDLGGMVDNPDRGDSYVPTTSSAVYLPRRGHHVYNGSAWVNEGLLHESEARSNLLTYSNDFTNADWIKLTSTVTANQTESPDGSSNASLLAADGTLGAELNVYDSVSLNSGTTYTFSVYLKATPNESVAQLYIYQSVFKARATFDLANGTATDVEGTGATIISLGNGWYRCSIKHTATTTTHTVGVYKASLDAEVYAYGAQLEAGSTPSSYIPTAGATVTRAAETLTIPSANLPWPTPQVISDELVTNGTFDTDSDWVKFSGWSITGGQAVNTSTTSGNIRQSGVTETGKVYQVSVDVIQNDGACTLRTNDGVTIIGDVIYSTGTFTYIFVATSSRIDFRSGFNTNPVIIDNISVREINPLSVSIQMDGRADYPDNGVAVSVRFFDWTQDASNSIFVYLRSDGTEGTLQFRQYESGVSDLVSVVSGYQYGSLVPFNIASRHGSTFINGAVDGAALTADTTPTALPDLSATDLRLGHTYMGTIKTFRIWDKDLGDTGIEEASS